MGAWSGRGIPPTRKKLHKERVKLERERAAELKARAGERGLGERDWRRVEKRADASGVSLASFWDRWCE